MSKTSEGLRLPELTQQLLESFVISGDARAIKKYEPEVVGEAIFAYLSATMGQKPAKESSKVAGNRKKNSLLSYWINLTRNNSEISRDNLKLDSNFERFENIYEALFALLLQVYGTKPALRKYILSSLEEASDLKEDSLEDEDSAFLSKQLRADGIKRGIFKALDAKDSSFAEEIKNAYLKGETE